MSETSKEDLEFCWQQAIRGDSWFRLHYVFAPKSEARRILALHALCSMLERPLGMSDESLALSQLAWWQKELSAEFVGASAHPVIRVMRATGAMARISPSLIENYTSRILSLLHTVTPSSREELKTFCADLGEARVRLESALVEREADFSAIRGQFAGLGLGCAVDLTVRNSLSRMWYVPLELQARQLVDMRTSPPESSAGQAVLSTVGEWADTWFSEQTTALEQALASVDPGADSCRHLVAYLASQQFKLSRTLRRMQGSKASSMGTWHFSDFMKVWGCCRKVAGPN